jgi:hypothetical protein
VAFRDGEAERAVEIGGRLVEQDERVRWVDAEVRR